MIQAPAPADLPPALLEAWTGALREAAAETRPLPRPWAETLEQAARGVAGLPPGDLRRLQVEGLRAAAAGGPGDAAWARCVQALHRQAVSRPGDPRPVEALARVLEAQGLDASGWRDRALDLRLRRSTGADGALEAAALAQVKAHWGGFLEPPRREACLEACARLLELWGRRPAAARTEAVAKVAFQEDAGPLWRFAWEEGPPELRAGLRGLLADLEAASLAPSPAFLAWVRALQGSGLEPSVRALVARMDEASGGTWPPELRLGLLLEARLEDRFRSAARAALRGGDPGLRDRLVGDLLLRGPDLGPEEQDFIRSQLDAWFGEVPPEVAAAWDRRLRRLGRGEEPEPGPELSEPPVAGLRPEEERRIGQALRTGRLASLEPELWALLEGAARGDRDLGEALEWLPVAVLGPALREGDPDGALARLARIERLLAPLGSEAAAKLRGALAVERPRLERLARLQGRVGPALHP